jgi:tRNA U34 2-thiouridine synthase MnmA/TrmU
MERKGLVLLSGGLDSTLAAKMMLEQGLAIEAVNFLTVFCTCTKKGSCKHEARRVADGFGVTLHIMNVSEEYLAVVRNPRYGYGKNMNPCIDCRIFMFKKAKDVMKTIGASFIITGEVLGERPMSQRRDAINIIERESGLKGLVVRPLSAHYFEPTLPEKEGIVDRDRLLDIKGRSRKPQIALAKALGIDEYLCPAGGCLLTDPGFAKRVKDLVEHDELNLPNIKLLKVGRHFRIDSAKVVIGRNKEDNERILALVEEGDVVIKAKNIPGPITLIRGNGTSSSLLECSAALTGGYTKEDNQEFLDVEYKVIPHGDAHVVKVKPCSKEVAGVQSI